MSGAPPAPVSPEIESARKLFEAGKRAEAKAAFEAIAKRDPRNADAALYLGRIALAEDDLDGAVNWLEKAVELRPSSSNDHLWLGRAYGQKAVKASVFKKPFLASKVKKEFQKAVDLDGENTDARVDLARFYILAPGIMGGSEEKAMQQAEEVKKRDKLKGHQCYAMIYDEQKKPELAIKEIEKAVQEDPKNVKVLFMLGQQYQSRGKHDQAFEVFESLAKRDPPENGAYYQIGKTAVISGKNLDRGEECFKIYLKSTPKEGEPPLVWAHVRLGQLYEKKGNPELARGEYNEALKLQPDHKEAKEALAKLH